MLERIGSVNDFRKGQGKVVSVKGQDVAVFNVDGRIFALNNTCPHRGGPLGEGELDGPVVTCPWHGWRFDVETGVSPVVPTVSAKKYEVKIEGNDVFVEI